MFDRRLVTDIGLALLIAFPAALPAAPSPGNADDSVGKTTPQGVQALAGVSERAVPPASGADLPANS